MRHSKYGMMAASMVMLAAVGPAVEEPRANRKQRRSAPSGKPIPQGPITRQQRRAAEREAAKGPKA